jgi:uncharacterized repeat protein (TIGR03803 family)
LRFLHVITATVVAIGVAFSSRADNPLTTLYSFQSDATGNPGGSLPHGGLNADVNGILYGTTYLGGTTFKNAMGAVLATGAVYSFDPVSKVQTPLANMDASGLQLPHAESNLASDPSGNMYGTTVGGGANGVGNLFVVAAGTHAVSTLISFDGTNYDPYGGVVADNAGNLFGAGVIGVYSVHVANHLLTTLATFDSVNAGDESYGDLYRDSSGNLYGTNAFGGAHNDGTVFKMNGTTHALSVLVAFNGSNGANPEGGLVADGAGNLFGTTSAGGTNSDGTIFEIDHTTGSLTTLANFNGTNGSQPMCTLLMDTNGNLFGSTERGGPHLDGTLFKIDGISHQLTTLYNFRGTDGMFPSGSLVLDSQGDLFGTTQNGGMNSTGTIFRLLVPEPSSIGMLAWIMAPMIVRRRHCLR